jgi:hypothetical protein
VVVAVAAFSFWGELSNWIQIFPLRQT